MKPHPANVPGDFYVEDGCCTMCEAPFGEAPGLFGVVQDAQGYSHCHIQRQPQTSEEYEQMVMAIRVAEFRCIRYCGTDRLVQLRLIEVDEGEACDGLPPDLQQAVHRRKQERQRADRNRQQRRWWKFWRR
jgi:hypothetical protein